MARSAFLDQTHFIFIKLIYVIKNDFKKMVLFIT